MSFNDACVLLPVEVRVDPVVKETHLFSGRMPAAVRSTANSPIVAALALAVSSSGFGPVADCTRLPAMVVPPHEPAPSASAHASAAVGVQRYSVVTTPLDGPKLKSSNTSSQRPGSGPLSDRTTDWSPVASGVRV